MKIIFHPHAKADLKSASSFYDLQADGLGSRFLAAFNHGIRMISRSPQAWPITYHHIRRYVMRDFPYSIIYGVSSAEELFLVAISHHSRRPDYWHSRLEQ